MNIKKLTAVIVTVILLLSLSACGNSGADIPISRLEFGMSEEKVKSVIRAEPSDGDEYSDSAFPVYIGTNDIDDDLQDCMFVFNSGRLYEIFLSSGEILQEDCFALRDKLIRKLSGLYGVSEDDWKIENNGYTNYYNYTNENGRLIQLCVRLYDIGDEGSTNFLWLIFRSADHSFSMFDDEEYINSIENIPVIPKK